MVQALCFSVHVILSFIRCEAIARLLALADFQMPHNMCRYSTSQTYNYDFDLSYHHFPLNHLHALMWADFQGTLEGTK